MDNTGNGYSSRGNAKKAAEAKINKGTSPAVDYGIKPGDDGRFYIAWQTAATTDEFAKTPEAQANQASWENMLDKALAPTAVLTTLFTSAVVTPHFWHLSGATRNSRCDVPRT